LSAGIKKILIDAVAEVESPTDNTPIDSFVNGMFEVSNFAKDSGIMHQISVTQVAAPPP